jgi:hypothetical protein
LPEFFAALPHPQRVHARAVEPNAAMENNQEAPRPALPLLALLALASALGVATAVVLAGVAMLLAAPAYAQEEQQQGQKPDGSLLLERRSGLAHAELLFVETESHEDGHLRLVETYHNPFAEPLTGVYLYRLPRNAVLEHLSFSLGTVEPHHALLTHRQGATLIERTTEIGPGETLLVELEYRSRRTPRRLLALR